MGQNWDIKSGPRAFLNKFLWERNNALAFHVSYWLSLVIMTQETSLLSFSMCWSCPDRTILNCRFSPATLSLLL